MKQANMVAAGKLRDGEVNHSYRPPYGIQGRSAVIRNNYGRPSLFTVYCLQMPLAQGP